MTRFRFLDAMGDVVAEREFEDRAEALAWDGDADREGDADAAGDEVTDLGEAEVTRVEYLGPDGDWRWAGALER